MPMQYPQAIGVIQQYGIGDHRERSTEEKPDHVAVRPHKAVFPVQINESPEHQHVGDRAGLVRVELEMAQRVGDQRRYHDQALSDRGGRRAEAHGPLVALADRP